MDSTITAFITLILVLEATKVRAGKNPIGTISFCLCPKWGQSDDLGKVGTDDGDPGID